MLLKLTLLARVHGEFEAQLSRDVPLGAERAQARKHLNTTLFLRALSDWRAGGDARTPSLWIMTGLLAGSLVLAPVATLLFAWIRFLPYQSEAVTMLHRIVFAFDVAAILVAFRAVTGRPRRALARRFQRCPCCLQTMPKPARQQAVS